MLRNILIGASIGFRYSRRDIIQLHEMLKNKTFSKKRQLCTGGKKGNWMTHENLYITASIRNLNM